MVGLKDFTKAEELYRLALDGFDKSLGKDHQETKNCAANLARLYAGGMKDKAMTRALAVDYQ